MKGAPSARVSVDQAVAGALGTLLHKRFRARYDERFLGNVRGNSTQHCRPATTNRRGRTKTVIRKAVPSRKAQHFVTGRHGLEKSRKLVGLAFPVREHNCPALREAQPQQCGRCCTRRFAGQDRDGFSRKGGGWGVHGWLGLTRAPPDGSAGSSCGPRPPFWRAPAFPCGGHPARQLGPSQSAA